LVGELNCEKTDEKFSLYSKWYMRENLIEKELIFQKAEKYSFPVFVHFILKDMLGRKDQSESSSGQLEMERLRL